MGLKLKQVIQKMDTQRVRSRKEVTPTTNKQQIQDIGAELARNGSQKIEILPPKIFGWG